MNRITCRDLCPARRGLASDIPPCLVHTEHAGKKTVHEPKQIPFLPRKCYYDSAERALIIFQISSLYG